MQRGIQFAKILSSSIGVKKIRGYCPVIFLGIALIHKHFPILLCLHCSKGAEIKSDPKEALAVLIKPKRLSTSYHWQRDQTSYVLWNSGIL